MTLLCSQDILYYFILEDRNVSGAGDGKGVILPQDKLICFSLQLGPNLLV